MAKCKDERANTHSFFPICLYPGVTQQLIIQSFFLYFNIHQRQHNIELRLSKITGYFAMQGNIQTFSLELRIDFNLGKLIYTF